MKTKLLSIMSLIVVAMKTKVLILSTIIALIGVLSVNAQETQNNESVEYTINYTKELLQKSDNKILLPKEVNYLLGCGDSDNIYLVPEWEDAYIEKGGNNILTYIVPLKGEANNVEIVAELNVVRETFSSATISTLLASPFNGTI